MEFDSLEVDALNGDWFWDWGGFGRGTVLLQGRVVSGLWLLIMFGRDVQDVEELDG